MIVRVRVCGGGLCTPSSRHPGEQNGSCHPVSISVSFAGRHNSTAYSTFLVLFGGACKSPFSTQDATAGRRASAPFLRYRRIYGSVADDSRRVAEGGTVQLYGSCRFVQGRMPKKGTTMRRVAQQILMSQCYLIRKGVCSEFSVTFVLEAGERFWRPPKLEVLKPEALVTGER